jgi:hypothetical protein
VKGKDLQIMKTTITTLLLIFHVIILSAQNSTAKKYNVFTRIGFRSFTEQVIGGTLFKDKLPLFDVSIGYIYNQHRGENSGCIDLQRPLLNSSYKGYRLALGHSFVLEKSKHLNLNFYYAQRKGAYNDARGGCYNRRLIRYNELQKEIGATLYIIKYKAVPQQANFYFGFGAGLRTDHRADDYIDFTVQDIKLHVDAGIRVFLLPVLKSRSLD